MLVLTRKQDEKIMVGDDIEITVVEIESGRVQLGIDAPEDVEIYREEIYRKIEQENIEAGQKQIDLEQLKDLNLKQEQE